MKEFKGTQGEWNSTLFFSNLETRISTGIKRIADVKHYNEGKGGLFKNDPDFNEGRANAQLIATAPELLEALQEMIELFPNENIDQQNAKVKAVLTINKALGL